MWELREGRGRMGWRIDVAMKHRSLCFPRETAVRRKGTRLRRWNLGVGIYDGDTLRRRILRKETLNNIAKRRTRRLKAYKNVNHLFIIITFPPLLVPTQARTRLAHYSVPTHKALYIFPVIPQPPAPLPHHSWVHLPTGDHCSLR